MDRDQGIKLMQDLLRRMVERKASGPLHHRGLSAGDQGRRRDPAADRPPLTPRAGAAAGALDHERPPDQGIRRDQGMQLRDRAAGHRPLPRQRLRAAGAHSARCMRTINAKIPTLEELELPPILKEVVLSKRGLCILVGGTGSGKSTSLAAMVDYRNEKTRGHIVTIEDPVEYVHPHKGCVITQREVGVDTDSWHMRAQEHAAPGAGRDPDRRNPRPRDDGVRHPVRRDRPPGARDAARQQRQPGAGPHHQLLPRGAARAAADGPVAEHPRA